MTRSFASFYDFWWSPIVLLQIMQTHDPLHLTVLKSYCQCRSMWSSMYTNPTVIKEVGKSVLYQTAVVIKKCTKHYCFQILMPKSYYQSRSMESPTLTKSRLLYKDVGKAQMIIILLPSRGTLNY